MNQYIIKTFPLLITFDYRKIFKFKFKIASDGKNKDKLKTISFKK